MFTQAGDARMVCPYILKTGFIVGSKITLREGPVYEPAGQPRKSMTHNDPNGGEGA